MKTTKFWRAIAIVLAAITCYTFYACSAEDPIVGPDPKPDPVDSTAVGVVAFTIESTNEEGTPTNIGDEPTVVETGDTLDVSISQTSSYTDPNGTVVTYKPKASVKLFAQIDTLHAKDLQTLMTVKELSKNTHQENSNELVRNLTEQKFDVGGKVITFDLMHEVYRHVNSERTTVEMPYIKVNPAQYGSASANEGDASTRSPSAVSGIRIRPLTPQTRSVVTDTTTYEVSVSFNLDLESVHTENAETKNLPFEVRFVAVIETSTEYPDPVLDFSYKLNILGGTTSTAPPFEVLGGNTLSLLWQQDSKYTYFSIPEGISHEIRYEPKAELQLAVAKDTLFIENAEVLESVNTSEPVITSEGENPTVYSGSQTYEIGGGQTISINWGYDAYGSIEIEGTQIALPYVELSRPELVGVAVTERPDVVLLNKEAVAYEVTVLFRQNVLAQNVSGAEPQTMEYVVKYMAVKEVRLTKVVYRKSWEWNTPHDNIILAWAPIVYRDRIYSDGKTFTDTFSGSFMFKSLSPVTSGGGNVPDPDVGAEFNWDGNRILYHPRNDTDMDSIFIETTSIGVTSLSAVGNIDEGDAYYISTTPGDWAKYGQSKLYDSGVNIPTVDGVDFVGNNGTSAKASGWYAWEIGYVKDMYVGYENSMPPLTNNLVNMKVELRIPDQFLVIDGKMINYLEYRGAPQTTIRTEDITMPNGAPARVYKLEGRQHFLDKNFYVAAIDTVYQFAP